MTMPDSDTIHIHHVELSHTSSNLSGGEKALIETVRYIAQNTNFEQSIYTSRSGGELYMQLLRSEGKNINFITIGSLELEKRNEILAYMLRLPQVFYILRRFPPNKRHIIFTHEEFVASTLFSFLEKKINPSAPWLVFFHMKSPGIFRGFEGEYTGKVSLPTFRVIRYRLEQSIFFLITRRRISKVITVNPIYLEFLLKKYRKLYTLKKIGGLPVQVLARYSGVSAEQSSTDKQYDLSFMGRFHAQKGIFELVDIMAKLKQVKPDISLAIIGGGSDQIKRKFFALAEMQGLADNIHYKGYISTDDKFETLQSSRVFVMPSYYESFGQAALEAMMCGLPVVAYDLPPFLVFKRGMTKVPILDNTQFASEVNRLLSDSAFYIKASKGARRYAETFSWSKTGEEITKLLRQLP